MNQRPPGASSLRRAVLLSALAGPLLLIGTATTAAAAELCYAAGGDNGQLGFSAVQEGRAFSGTFRDFSVRYCMDENAPEDGAITVTVATSSARTGEAMRDDVLQGAEFFFTGRFPEARWTSSVIAVDDDGYLADGELTIRDLTHPVPVTFTLHPDNGGLQMQGRAALMRLDFDVGTGENANPNFIGHEVEVEFDLTLQRTDP